MSNETVEQPRVFISYSWTTPEYEQRVVDLAEKLVEMGVDVVLDKWDLVEGADVNAYMEKMVTDKSISKVLMLCDKAYAEKADGRKGGVGTETLIVTPQIYRQADPAGKEQRFIPVIMERYENRQACCPTFLSSRNYIDMSSPELFDKGFEQVLRTIYNKPVHKKPELGKPPAFILKDEVVTLGSTAKHSIAFHALQEGKTNALGACKDYFDTVVENLERFRVEADGEGELDDRIVQSLEMLEEPKNELLSIFSALIRYHLPPEQAGETLRRFLERLYPFTQWPEDRRQWVKTSADNYRFFLHELFLSAVAIALKEEKFRAVPELLQDFYFVSRFDSFSMRSYVKYRQYLESIDRTRKDRLKLNRLSLHADLLKQRTEICQYMKFYQIMQADFFLFLHSILHEIDSGYGWFPTTLVYAEFHHPPFEIFARAQSTAYFDKMKVAFGIDDKAPLVELCDKFARNEIEAPWRQYVSISPSHLAAIETIATKA